MTDSKKNEKSSRNQLAAKFQYGPSTSLLPPIGVFWDIENCQVPKGKSATALVQNIRERFFKGHREAEFMCVCDISKESREVIHELNMAQVTVVHINATSKNAADDKLKQCMRRFVDVHGNPSTVVLISSDVNFSTDLSDFRHRRKVTVILIHTDHAPEPLLACGHRHFRFEDLTCTLPYRSPAKGQTTQTCELVITELPVQRDTKQIQHRLRQLSDNCGGRVLSVVGSTAILRFPNHESAQRARKRMDKEDVYGSKISVSFSNRVVDGRESSPHGRGSRKSRSCSGSSREPSPVQSAASSSQSLEEQGCRPITKNDRPVSAKKLSQSNSETFMPTVEVTNGGRPIRRSESLSTGALGSVAGRENSLAVHKQGGFETKRNKTPQKNIGRVSPFMKSDTVTKRDVHVQADRGIVADGSRSNGASPAVLHSPANARVDRRLNTWNDLMVLDDALPSRASPTFFAVPATPVELLVTNLDQNVETNEMKKILLAAFREHVMVLHISMLLQSDGSLKAVVKVPSTQDAQFAISQLHRRKIGSKRILISYISNDRIIPLHILRAEVVALLNDIPARKLPLFKFRDLFESRYHRAIGIPELYKLSDVVVISEDSMGRMVSINPEYRPTPSPVGSDSSKMYLELIEKSYCERHFHVPESHGWAEMESVYPLPDVNISLKTLSPHVHTLLDSHQGSLPLNSFCACYRAEFGPLLVARGDESNEAGSSREGSYVCCVPLEHLIACIPGVQIVPSSLGIKKIQWLENKTIQEQQTDTRCISPALVGQLLLFGKEMIDLLKSQPTCSIPFNKFIPTYHHHFGRQCRVADYGFTKLLDLLEAIPHIVQILGQGHNRTLTLTHRCQVKRFAGDLVRVLKSVTGKQLLLSELPQAYEQNEGRPLDIAHYGVCSVTDMLTEVTDSVVVTTTRNADTLISIPKREQTAEEVELTKEFCKEVIELLRHTPGCRMSFNKFIPTYHHHFGHQCRVSDYGFGKLVDLFESIPSLVEVRGTGEDKTIELTQEEKLKIVSERVGVVVRSSPKEEIRLDLIPPEYTRIHGHSLQLSDFGCISLHQLLSKMKDSVKLKQTVNGPVVTVVDCSQAHHLSQRVYQLLMELPKGEIKLDSLATLYLQRFKTILDVAALKSLKDDVLVENGFVRLSKRQLMARDILILLTEIGGQLSLQNFDASFTKLFGTPCSPTKFGFNSISDFLQSFPDYLLVRGRRGKKSIALNHDSVDFLLPSVIQCCKARGLSSRMSGSDDTDSELLMGCFPVDLLSQPIPSNVPSPEIQPEPEPFFERDLMGFESPMPSHKELICDSSNRNEHLLLPPLHFMSCRASYSAPSLYRPWTAPQHHPDVSFLSTTTEGSETTPDTSLESNIPSRAPSLRSRPRNRLAAQFSLPQNRD